MHVSWNKWLVTIFLAAIMPHTLYSMDHTTILNQSLNYIQDLPDNCALADGYTCLDDANIANTRTTAIPGNYLKAWSICYEDFLNIEDLTEEQKQMRHYKIFLSQEPNHYTVEFVGLLLPYVEQGHPVSVLTGVYGRSTKYWVDKNTFNISKRLFYK